jgi:hypothetical protein
MSCDLPFFAFLLIHLPHPNKIEGAIMFFHPALDLRPAGKCVQPWQFDLVLVSTFSSDFNHSPKPITIELSMRSQRLSLKRRKQRYTVTFHGQRLCIWIVLLRMSPLLWTYSRQNRKEGVNHKQIFVPCCLLQLLPNLALVYGTPLLS